MSPGTLRILGLLNILFGAFLALGSCVGLMGFLGQRAILARLPEDEFRASLRELHATLGATWLLFFPIAAVLGLVFALAGSWLRRGEQRGITASRGTIAIGFLAYLGYALTCVGTADRWNEVLGSELGESAMMPLFMAISVLTGGVMLFAYPVVLLVFLRQPLPQGREST